MTPNTEIAGQVETRVIEAIASLAETPADVTRDARLAALALDSLDLVELTQMIEDDLGIALTAEDAAMLVTAGDVIDLVTARLA